jgi:hypothetical protein
LQQTGVTRRSLFGIIIGIVLTAGTAFIADSLAIASVTTDATSRQIVNWDVAKERLHDSTAAIRVGWERAVRAWCVHIPYTDTQDRQEIDWFRGYRIDASSLSKVGLISVSIRAVADAQLEQEPRKRQRSNQKDECGKRDI